MPRDTCHISHVTCHMSHVPCQVSGVACLVSHVTSSSQAVRARELKFWEKVHLLPSVICHVSHAASHAGTKKMLSAPFLTPAETKILVLKSALVERFNVSRMRDFFLRLWPHGLLKILFISCWILSICCLWLYFSWKLSPQIKHLTYFTVLYYASNNVHVNKVCF